MLKVFSGSCCMCDVGIKTGETDWHGNQLFTGDIVQLWYGNYIGTDAEEWMPSSGLTVIVSKQYQTNYDGLSGEHTHRLEHNDAKPFTMGIAETGVQGGYWRVTLVKSHKDIIEGERLPDYGFNYRTVSDTGRKVNE